MNPFIQIRRDLHRIPELGFQEFKTQKYLLNYLTSFQSNRLIIETWKTGIFVFIKGMNPTKTIGYRTDIDGLPIKEETGLLFTSEHPNEMHACGHDVHMSIALGVLTYFVENPISDNLLFIFQPAEEGPGGAKPMMETDFFQRHKPDTMVALHIAPELPLGVIATKAGTLFAACSEIDVEIKGKSSHVARPHLGIDAIVVASHLINQMQVIVNKNISPLESAVVTFGKITGGTVRNITSDYVSLEGTIRTLNSDTMDVIKRRLSAIISGLELTYGCEVNLAFNNDYAEVDNHPHETNEFISFIKDREDVVFKESEVAMTAEDYGYYLKEIPGFMFWLGAESESGLHTSTLNPKEEAIPIAIPVICDYIKKKIKDF